MLVSELPLPLMSQGKVRDIYAVGEDRLLLVTTDRLSAFDVVFKEGIPGKGCVLTSLSTFWAGRLPACQPYHLITDELDEMDFDLGSHREELRGRVQLVERLDMLPVECVVRGYLTGSGWKDYQAAGHVCGHPLPQGLHNGDRLPAPLFTPATKAADGEHDQNISFERVVEMVGRETAEELRQRSVEIYKQGARIASERGLILVDTKLEYGRRADGTLVLADEVLTPDSSRYWDEKQAAAAEPGKTPPSYDKQVVRDYLETLDWNKRPPPPVLPSSIVNKAASRYEELASRLSIRRINDV